MDALRQKRDAATLPESSIVLFGLLLTIVGLLFRDSIGITPLLTAVGIGLIIAGTVYIAANGPEWTRLSLAFISLVAVQLVAFNGVVQWIGGVMIGTVVATIPVNRFRSR